nr:MAG TPA: hypothetical protein [Caudoviricetes sp.]
MKNLKNTLDLSKTKAYNGNIRGRTIDPQPK